MPIVIDIKCDLVLSQHDTQSLQQSVHAVKMKSHPAWVKWLRMANK